MTIEERFWDKVAVGTEDECWLWLGSTNGHGYGQLSTTHGSPPVKAHRVSYEIHRGAIPDGLNVLHECDNPGCVNPAHLITGTQVDNMRGASERGRLNPISLNNLQPGAPGFNGAGPKRR